ncbi:MAG: DUF1926 domain-containing protein [Termitinemataceae bacterium]|nr:MAG: DUF1926 domain-containing protein [Termitinemataceae bacterium]
MEKSIEIILGLHFHLPHGTKAEDYEYLYEHRIKVFISALYRYSNIPVVIHISGNLYNYIEREHPELFMVINDMIKIKQVELLSGGFFEPMMPLLQPAERVSQIEMLTTYIRRNFGKRSYGCWLPDIAWDQNMVSTLNSCNIAWTFLDAARFSEVGVKHFEHCITEDKGKLVTVFPHAKTIRNAFETKPPKDCLEEILAKCTNHKNIFAIFPRTIYSEDVNGNPTLEDMYKFLDSLTEYSEKIEWTLPSKVVKNNKAVRKVFFNQKNVKQFLLEYPAANNLYAKMIWGRSVADAVRGDKIRKSRSQYKVCRAAVYNLFCEKNNYEETLYGVDGTESNCLEHPELRAAAFSSILDAERIAREINPVVNSIINSDFLLYGENDFIYQGKPINCLIKRKGGAIFELDYMPKTWNYVNTFNVASPRLTFADTIASPSFTIDDIHKTKSAAVHSFANEMYEIDEIDRAHGKLKLSIDEHRHHANGLTNVHIEKFYHIKKNKITVNYEIKNTGNTHQSFIFITELNISFCTDYKNKLRIYYFQSPQNADEAQLKDLQQELQNGNHAEKFQLDHALSNVTEIENAAAINFEDLQNEAIINLSCNSNFKAQILHEIQNGLYQSTRILVQKSVDLEAAASSKITFVLSFLD